MKAYIFPGQGAQFKGMGKDLFSEFPDHTKIADEILGYSIEELCIDDPQKRLGNTLYTQPAMFVVNALSYLKLKNLDEQLPDYVAGHSLGEYNALFAAECFSFEQGLRLVLKRASVMSEAKNGGMAAILGALPRDIQSLIEESGLNDIQIANMNTMKQNIVSGAIADLREFEKKVQQSDFTYIPLPVSGAFHSKYMEDSRKEFTEYLRHIEFNWLRIPVISNVEALPYSQAKIKTLLALQITSPVRWFESMQYLRGNGVHTIDEVGQGDMLTKMLSKIDVELKTGA